MECHEVGEMLNDNKWYGLDPNNKIRKEYDYIKIGQGRYDYDCTVKRGIFTGNAIQKTERRVNVFAK